MVGQSAKPHLILDSSQTGAHLCGGLMSRGRSEDLGFAIPLAEIEAEGAGKVIGQGGGHRKAGGSECRAQRGGERVDGGVWVAGEGSRTSDDHERDLDSDERAMGALDGSCGLEWGRGRQAGRHERRAHPELTSTHHPPLLPTQPYPASHDTHVGIGGDCGRASRGPRSIPWSGCETCASCGEERVVPRG